MTNALLLLPDFLLIAIGFALCRWTMLNRPIWEGVERLVYFVLFPVLLFNSIMRSPLHVAETLDLAAATVGITLAGIVLALAIGRWPGVDARRHASGAQTAFRFNSYIALALAERLGGAGGLTWMALALALCVPIVNVAAVWPLARHGGQPFGRELLRNPLLIATVAGLACNLLGLALPALATTTLQRIGSAALPLALMGAGASLRIGSLNASPGLTAAFMAIRHALLPAVAIGLVAALALPPEQRAVIVLFAALPTASSAYVLASRMGGDGPYVAALITLSTLLGMLSIPFWLAVLAWTA